MTKKSLIKLICIVAFVYIAIDGFQHADQIVAGWQAAGDAGF